jgi:hypothetical protein
MMMNGENHCGCNGATSQPTYNSRNSMQAFRAEALRRARTLYLPDTTGTLLLELSPDGPVSATALVTEHRPAENRQLSIQIEKGQRVSRILPAGGYTIVAFAKGYKPHRGYIELAADQTTQVCLRLDEPAADPPSFAERAAKYGLQISDPASLRNFAVEDGATMALDPSAREFAGDVRMLEISNVEDAKRILGHSDEYWAGSAPRYGKMVQKEPPTLPMLRDETNLHLDARFALREYIYGNSQTVSGWKGYLNKWLSNSAIRIPIFLFQDVTVGPHSTLYIGSSGLFCHNLNVHYTAKVVVNSSGPTFIDVTNYNQYGWFDIPWKTPVLVNL